MKISGYGSTLELAIQDALNKKEQSFRFLSPNATWEVSKISGSGTLFHSLTVELEFKQ